MMRLAIFAFLLALLAGGLPPARAQQQSPAAADKAKPKPAKGVAEDKAQAETTQSEGQTQKKSSVEDNPFPEEQSKSAAKGAESGTPPPDFPESTGKSEPTDQSGRPSDGREAPFPDNNSSSSRTRLEGLDDVDPDASRKVKRSVAEPVHNPKLSSEDVAIGKMYFQTENYRGAYVRYREALSLDPENADAAFGVGETARKLNQRDEAVENYKLYLNLDPTGPRAKAARKALAALSPVVGAH